MSYCSATSLKYPIVFLAFLINFLYFLILCFCSLLKGISDSSSRPPPFCNSYSNLEIIEVQLGTYLGEDDIIRYEDDYNRI